MYIDGQWVEAAATYPTYSPIDTSLHDGQLSGRHRRRYRPRRGRRRAAYPGWRATPWQERVALLRQAAEIISERLFAIAAVDSLEVGKNRLEALGDVEEAADFIRTYCDVCRNITALPCASAPKAATIAIPACSSRYGVWAVISPFNFPIALSGGPTAAALIAGNTVVLKPAEDTPYGPTLLVECFAEAGLPPGVINLVTGQKETGRALVDHPGVDGITFTGSYRVGMEIYAKVAGGRNPRPVITEMGGKNPAIVGPLGQPGHGRRRGGPRRIWPQRPEMLRLLARLRTRRCQGRVRRKACRPGEKVQIGDPTQQENWMGPVINRRAYEAYKAHVAECAPTACSNRR